MSQDASQASLSERIRSRGFAPDLTQILLDVVELAKQQQHEAEHREALARAAAPAPTPRPRRDRHGMHAIRGGAGVALLATAARWAARVRAHKVATAALTAAVAGTAVVAPSIMTARPAPLMAGEGTGAALIHPHHQLPASLPARAARPVHHRRRRSRATTATPVPSPSPSDLAPSPSPTDSDPSPSPSVTVTVPPVQVIIQGLRAPLELAWDDMPPGRSVP